MIMRTAGGPGLIGPLTHTKRNKHLTASNLAVFGVVVLAYVGLGLVIHYQSFGSGPVKQNPPEQPPVIITLERPRPAPPVTSRPEPTAAAPPLDRPVANPLPAQDPLVVSVSDKTAQTQGLVVNFSSVSPDATGTAATPEPPSPPAVITRPDWISRPGAAQMSRAFPERALADGIGGAATLRCLVLMSGNLAHCTVTGETPGGKGFGRAALGLTRYFKLSPRTVDGQAVDGAAVVFTVRFGLVD